MSGARRKAQEAWNKADKARVEYDKLLQEFEQEEQELRREAGLCGPAYPKESRANSPDCGESIPSMEVVSGYKDGKKQIVVREREEHNPWLTSPKQKPASLYPTLKMNEGEDEWGRASPEDPPTLKEEHSTPKVPQDKEMKKEPAVATIMLPTNAQKPVANTGH